MPGDSNPDAPKGNLFYRQARPTVSAWHSKLFTDKLGRGPGSRTQSRLVSDACRVSSAVACRPPRPLHEPFCLGAGAVIRTLCSGFGDRLLSQEHPGIWQRAEGSNPTGSSPVHRFRNGSATIHRRPLFRANLVLEERIELSRPNGHRFLRPARLPITPLQRNQESWSANPDSNRIRAGLQSAASTTSAFGANVRYSAHNGIPLCASKNGCGRRI